MNGNFKVGEVLVIHSLTLSADLNGMECIVLSAAIYGQGISRETGQILPANWAHDVEVCNGLLIRMPIMNLRRKQPPSGEKSVMDLFKAPQPERMGELA